MGIEGIALPFLTSALDGDEWSASRLCRFNPGEGAPGTRWIGDRVGLRAGMIENTPQNYWVFGLFPTSGILENRKHDISETGSVSVLR
jgi:hypothetical protein